jgi:hypothetical protein
MAAIAMMRIALENAEVKTGRRMLRRAILRLVGAGSDEGGN